MATDFISFQKNATSFITLQRSIRVILTFFYVTTQGFQLCNSFTSMDFVITKYFQLSEKPLQNFASRSQNIQCLPVDRAYRIYLYPFFYAIETKCMLTTGSLN